jgi:GGDEF domain-containing protein
MKRNLSPTPFLDPSTHDGIHDALTFLPAPAYFYEYLYREISIIERSGDPLTLIKILIKPRGDEVEIENYEVSIINFAKALNRCIRRSDLAARIGRYEFVLAITSHQKAPTEITERLISIWSDDEFTFSYTAAHYQIGDRALSILERLDRAESYEM